MSVIQGPGKTTPRFIQDVLSYDPVNLPRSGFNILTHIPPVYNDQEPYPELISSQCCPHVYITKPNQTKLLPDDRQIPGVPYKVSSVCTICRLHLELGITYPRSNIPRHTHIHHLVPLPSNSKESNPFEAKGQGLETYRFRCSYSTCAVQVSVKFLSPLITPKWVKLLTDPELVQQRAEEVIKTSPERYEGLGLPLPIAVLNNLRTYIEHSLQDKQRTRSIAFANKRFNLCFGLQGEPCKELLEFLEFTSQDDAFWHPPRPSKSATLPYDTPLNIFLDNAAYELLALINQRPKLEAESQPVDIHNINIVNSVPHFERLLDLIKYDRMDSDLPPGRPPYYEDLGTVEGSTSSMILQAYHKQIETDPARAPYYLRCLKTLADWRHDSDGRVLAEAVEREYTEGRYTDHDIPKAYNYFQLNPADRTLTDDYIINCFFARLTDAPNDMEPRRQLWRIGDHRQSEKIKAAAEERVANVEQALVFLGAERETGDDFIISMYTAKISDNPASKALAQKAVSLIAEARQSDSLRHFLKTGELGTPEMDVAEAFCLLQIPDRTADESAILAAFSVCCSEAPGQINSYRRALDIIAKERGSAMLSSTLAEDATHTIPVRFDWPVGLRNIGNTCYLNSLLQFYFTIAPFRRMVLNFEDFKMPLDEESVKKKQVGSRKVSLAEIERSQKFVCELRKLFTDMIESPNSAVTPEQELARLTLISSSNEAAIRRKSIISSTRPGLGEIHGMPILGPLGPPTTTENDGTRTAPATATVTEEETSSKDWASDTTLAGLTRTNNSPLTVPDNKENIKLPLDDDDDDNVEMEEVNDSQSPPKAFGPIGPPNRPPPVPPRPAPQIDRQQLIKEEVELGAQQDVTEVINNVLFQTQCAIKPDRIDGDGEQVDLIKNLFYGRNKSHIKSQKGDRSKEELWADIKVDVATGPRDIYSALDGAFDEQWVEVEGSEARQFSTITNIPPVLQVQVQRVQFDQVKKTSFKSTHHLELKETIYLDRYMDASEESEVTKRREESWRWKSELRGLRARKAELINNENWTSLSDVFKDARTSLEDLVTMKDDPETAEEALEIDDSIIETLANLEHAAKEEIERIEAREKHLTTLIETQFSDSRLLPYRLYAVFIHHGSVEFGHYYIYIFDFEKNIWRKYNDSEVTEVHNTAEIFGNTGMINPPTPYFVVYVSDKHKDRAVEPVHRNIVEPVSTLVATNPDNDNAVMIDIPPEGMDVNMSDPPAYEELEGSLPSGMSSKPSSQTPQEPISTPGVLVTTTEVDPSDSPCLNPLKRKGEQGQGRGGWRSSDIDF